MEEPVFSNPLDVVLEINTRRGVKFVQIVKDLDRVVGFISLLWLHGVRSDEQYAAESYLWQRNVMRLGNRIRQIAVRAIIAANNARNADNEAGTNEGEMQSDEVQEAIHNARETDAEDDLEEGKGAQMEQAQVA